jgi:inorganic pyrophosphatase
MLGRIVTVIVDRPLGSAHPKYPSLIYPVNYGYVPDVIAPDGEEQDVYILGVDTPIDIFTGKIIAVIRRKNDVEDKWVAAPMQLAFTEKEIRDMTDFQERYFDIEIEM